MSHRQPVPFRRTAGLAALLVVISLTTIISPATGTTTITSLAQLTQAASGPPTPADLDLHVVVCASSRPKVGVLIVQDETGVELLQVGDFQHAIAPGERVRIRQQSCRLRKREMGVEISAMPLVSNDGLHSWKSETNEVVLRAGKTPVRFEWFNYWRLFGVNVSWAASNEPLRRIEASNLWHAVVTQPGTTNFLPGLRAECFEGAWEALPDFNLLQPVKEGVETNVDLNIRSRDELVGIRYSGFLNVPRDGLYKFATWSDDGSLLFLGNPNVPIVKLGGADVPTARPTRLLEADFSSPGERRWAVVEGRVSFVSKSGEGVKFDLGTDRRIISVRVADARGLDLSALLNCRVKVTGLARPVMTTGQLLVLGKLFVASGKDLVFVEPALGRAHQQFPITSIAQVQSLPIEEARKALPVRIRGTVTGAFKTSQEHWMSFQDDTRGVFVQLRGITNAAPAFGEFWEVEGHSGAGDFAPIVIGRQLSRLGDGLLPSPVKPTWTELLNGSRDVQWAELTGLVTEVQSNTISLHLPEGRLDVELEGTLESELKPFVKTTATIRGVLYAVWDATTREVRVGRVRMRSSAISVEAPAAADPFDAVLRTPRELLLFDAQASAFRPVKVRGQIIYADSTQLFLQSEGAGLRVLPTEKFDAHAGDLVDVVGFPTIGKTELVLREAQVRQTGKAPLPPAKRLAEPSSSLTDLNSTRVRVDGKLLGWHVEEAGPVLEMQSGNRLYLARLASGKSSLPSFRPGSRLALEGVYVGRGNGQISNADNESFDLLLNSLADITVLSQPTWWTLPRLLAVLGLLVVVLIFTVVWNTQLRQLVEQRTTQLQSEIRERERVERQHAVEAERSRIARDLHDDLGSSLTEISVLASTGQFPQTSAASQANLFHTIGAKARSLISALEVIVWAVDPEDNSIQSLADYLTGYTNEFFSHTQIACRFKVPVALPPITLEGRVRHDLLLAVKEALNNVVRHAGATEVEFRLALANDRLEIDIADNGKGIANNAASNGHGLKNLSARLTRLGGTCTIEPRAGGGTIVRIRLPVPGWVAASPVELASR
jgi:signal transduction histidine kinase